MAPTPSWLRASSMDVSQSGLSGAMLAEGFEGGRMPAADAGDVPANPAATVLRTMAPTGSRSVATRRRALRSTVSFPSFLLFVRGGIGRKGRKPNRTFRLNLNYCRRSRACRGRTTKFEHALSQPTRTVVATPVSCLRRDARDVPRNRSATDWQWSGVPAQVCSGCAMHRRRARRSTWLGVSDSGCDAPFVGELTRRARTLTPGAGRAPARPQCCAESQRCRPRWCRRTNAGTAASTHRRRRSRWRSPPPGPPRIAPGPTR